MLDSRLIEEAMSAEQLTHRSALVVASCSATVGLRAHLVLRPRLGFRWARRSLRPGHLDAEPLEDSRWQFLRLRNRMDARVEACPLSKHLGAIGVRQPLAVVMILRAKLSWRVS